MLLLILENNQLLLPVIPHSHHLDIPLILSQQPTTLLLILSDLFEEVLLLQLHEFILLTVLDLPQHPDILLGIYRVQFLLDAHQLALLAREFPLVLPSGSLELLGESEDLLVLLLLSIFELNYLDVLLLQLRFEFTFDPCDRLHREQLVLVLLVVCFVEQELCFYLGELVFEFEF